MRHGSALAIVLFGSLFALASCSSDSGDASPSGDDDTTTDDTGDGGSQEPLPEYKSGTRLRANLVGGQGDAKLFTGWYDKTLKANCAFALAEDGQQRCLPSGAELGSTYSDSACTLRAVVVTPTCKVPAFAVGEGTCEQGPVVLRVGSKLTTTLLYVKQKSGSCASLPANGQDVYEAVAPVAAGDMVSAEESTGTSKDGLAVLSRIAEDGAVETISAVDTEHAGLCDAKTGNSGRCLPSQTAFEQTFFKDAGCKTSAAIYSSSTTSCGRTPSAVLRPSGSASTCGDTAPSYAAVGAKVSGTVYQNQGVCEASTETSASFYEVGQAMALTDFPALKNQETGSSRIQVRSATSSSGMHILDRGLFDQDRSEECAPAPASDGATRCLPLSSSRNDVRYFSDAKCTKPIAFVGSECTPPSSVRLVTNLATACGEYNVRVFQVGEKTSPTTIYQSNGGSCDATPAPSGTDLYRADEEIPASAFAEIESKTE